MITIKKLEEKLKNLNKDVIILDYNERTLLERVKTLKNHEGKLVKHFKGKMYRIIGVVEHTETGEALVIYKAMYGEYKKYARPVDMFLSPVDKEKYPEAKQDYRFEFVFI